MKAHIPCNMTKAQRKAMDEEIRKRVLEVDEEWSIDADAVVLWTLHKCFGFGQKRIRQFWEACLKEHKRLREYYELPPEDSGWLYRRKLKEIGVDVEGWYKELS